jgi:predicted regulator of Ras-like GTPase activity (Roadblock/LC7/MglB family)
LAAAEKARRSMVLDVRAPCDRVLDYIASRSPVEYAAGAAKVLNYSEKKGSYIVYYASTGKGEYRVEISVSPRVDGVAYTFKGAVEGSITIAGLPRGGGCRLYIEAQASGPLIAEYGGEALGRIVNRIVVSTVSKFPAVLMARAPVGRLGDVFIELLELVNMASGGSSRVAVGGTVRSLAINVLEGKIISATGFGEEEAEEKASKLSEMLRTVMGVIESLGWGGVERVVISTRDHVVVASTTGGIATVAILEKKGEE